LRSHWLLAPDIDFLNHGSFGACPRVVLQAQRKIQDDLEREPIRFLAPERELEAKLDEVRQGVADLVNIDTQDIAFVRNATDGVNAVLRSFPFQPGDEVVVTNHGYNACINAAHYAVTGASATLMTAFIPFPSVDNEAVLKAIEETFTDRTKLLLIDHVTSFSGLVLPLERIIKLAHRYHIRVLVDGAHAPGMVPVDLKQLNADYYTANHHKWLCGPKASGFLYVRKAFQSEVRPTVISHAANRARPGRSRFIAEFDWGGTYDPSPLLALPASIQFLTGLRPGGLQGLMNGNRQLALEARDVLIRGLGIEPPAPQEMIGSLVTLPLPAFESTTAGDLDNGFTAVIGSKCLCFLVPTARDPGFESHARLTTISLSTSVW
jgi:isopenicillin-N epimerase